MFRNGLVQEFAGGVGLNRCEGVVLAIVLQGGVPVDGIDQVAPSLSEGFVEHPPGEDEVFVHIVGIGHGTMARRAG